MWTKDVVTTSLAETCSCGSSTQVTVTNGGFAANNAINDWRAKHICTNRPPEGAAQ